VLISLLGMLRGFVRSHAALHLEVLALRHQLQVLQRSRQRRLRFATADRWLWAWLSRSWSSWRTALVIVEPETVIAWHRQGVRLFWTWKSRRRSGRPPVPPCPGADPDDLAGESVVASAMGSWRATEVGTVRLSGDRCEVHGTPEHTAIAIVAHLSDESRPATAMGIQEVRTSARSPYQNACVERFIGSARRECLDHIIVLTAAGRHDLEVLCDLLYGLTNASPARQGLAPVTSDPPTRPVIAISKVRGLHHRYERRAA
jgi:hypothetical protein